MDFLEKLKQLAEGGGMGGKKVPLPIRTKIVWNIIEKDDTILLLLPNITTIQSIENEELFQEFRETIQEIRLAKPRYIVACVNGIDFRNDIIQLYEQVYGVEMQWLSNLQLLKNPQFMEYHNAKTIYLLKEDLVISEPDNSHFKKAILDVLDFDKDAISYLQKIQIPLHYGKCFLEEIVNVNIYMNKLMERIQSSLESVSDNSYDVTFIIGKTNLPFQKIYNMIMETFKTNQCSMVFSCNNELTKNLSTIQKETKTKVPLVEYDNSVIDIDIVHDLVGRLQRISSRFTTHVFIGEFSFDSKEVKETWYKHLEYLENVSIYDANAYHSLLKDIKGDNKNKFRLSKEVLSMIDMFLCGNTDPLGKKEEGYDEEYDEEDEKEDDEDEDHCEDCCDEDI